MNAASKGYVTIATGKTHYYKIAKNLLESYRLNASGNYPFAIICDRDNKYTAAFDKVVRMDNPTNSYMDKLRLFDCLPWEETIFIDADCLVYGDIDRWWKLFEENGSPCSVFGCAYADLDTDRGWFRTAGMGEFRDQIHFVPSFSGGVYYLTKTEDCKKVFDIAKYAAARYRDYPFAIFRDPADEPVIALGMAVANCRPTDCSDVGLYTYRRFTHADILAPQAEWQYQGQWRPILLIHWGNFGTMKAFYLFECAKMHRKAAGKPEKGLGWFLLYRCKLLYVLLHICDLITLGKRIKRRIMKKLRELRR